MQNPKFRGAFILLLTLLAVVAVRGIGGESSTILGIGLVVGFFQFLIVVKSVKDKPSETEEALTEAKLEIQRLKREASVTKNSIEDFKTKVIKAGTTLSSLAMVAKAIGQSLDLDTVLGSIMAAVESMGAQKASIWLLEEESKKVRLVSSVGWPEVEGELRLSLGEGLIGWVAEHGTATDDIAARRDPALAGVVKKSRYDSKLCVPLVINKKCLGVLNIGKLDRSRVQDEGMTEERRMIRFLGSLAALSINNAKVFGATKEFAEKDGLTGLYNHRYYQDTMDRELKRAHRYGDPVSILLTDIDKFKSFNDTYGHQIGDEVLAKTAHLLAELARDSDIPCRYGGEEFVLILPHTGKSGAAQVAERLRSRVEGTVYDTAKGPLQVTLSVGVATFPDDGQDKNLLVKLCDEALYRAKEGGRNRVELAIPEGQAPPEAAPVPAAPAEVSVPPSVPPAAPQLGPELLQSTDLALLTRAQAACVQKAKALAAAGRTPEAKETANLARAIANRRAQLAAAQNPDAALQARAQAAARIQAAKRSEGGQTASQRAARARQTLNQGKVPPS